MRQNCNFLQSKRESGILWWVWGEEQMKVSGSKVILLLLYLDSNKMHDEFLQVSMQSGNVSIFTLQLPITITIKQRI